MVNASNLRVDTFQRRMTNVPGTLTTSLKSNKASFVKSNFKNSSQAKPKTLRDKFDSLSNKQKLALGLASAALLGASAYGIGKLVRYAKTKDTKRKLKKEFT